MKKTLAVLIVFLAVIFAFGARADAADIVNSGTCGGEGDGSNLIWTLYDDGSLNIRGTGRMADYSIDNGTYAPWYDQRESVNSVEMSEGVTTVGSYAFLDCSSMADLSIPETVTSIGSMAFNGCESLTELTIGNNVERIENDAFSACAGLTKLTIGKNVAFIGSGAFSYCQYLTEIHYNAKNAADLGQWDYVFARAGKFSSGIDLYLGDTVETVPARLFDSSSESTRPIINTVHLGYGVSSIGLGAFDDCTDITDVYFSGTAADWEAIAIADGNDPLLNAGIHYLLSITASGNCGGEGDGSNLVWTLYDDGSLKISGTGRMADYSSDVYAPWYPYREQMTRVTIGSGVSSIGDRAFYSCYKIADITIPDSVISLGDRVFGFCSGLTSITIPDSVSSTGVYLFYYCSNLTSFTWPAGLTRIEERTFSHCRSLISVTIPEGVMSIGPYAFYGCSYLQDITLPDGMVSIEDRAFDGCSHLASITIPVSVTSIGDYAFDGCSFLSDVYYNGTSAQWDAVSIGDRNYYLVSGAQRHFATASGTCGGEGDGTNLTWFLYDDGELKISGTGTMKEYYTGSGMTYAPWYSYREQINSVSINNGVTNIGSVAFYYCRNLRGLTIPDSVMRIGNFAFSGCSRLVNITIPDTVSVIGDRAFDGCTGLADVYYPGTQEQWNAIHIGIYNEPLLEASIHYMIIDSGYCGGEGDGTNLAWMLDSDGLLTISGTGQMADWMSFSYTPWYYSLDRITAVIIGSGATSIGKEAFCICKNITSAAIPDGVISIGDHAFEGCSSLTDFTIPDSVTSIGNSAFASCSCITSITIPYGITEIMSYTFGNCRGLTSITIPDSVTYIGDSALSYCTSLTSLKIPDGVTSIGGSAFADCTGLTSITIPDGVTVIRSYLLDGCSGLTSITLPDGVTTIEEGAFARCSSLTGITLPDAVTVIGPFLFESCTSLTSMTIPGGITSIGTDTFYGCSSLASITLPDSISDIASGAFHGCSGLSDVYFTGTRAQWNAITIGDDNDPLLQANIHCIIASGYCGGEGDGTNLAWVLADDGMLTISGTGKMADYRTATYSPFFSYRSQITGAAIDSGVTSIGDQVFGLCTNLESITIPDTVTSIGSNSFGNCRGLSGITIPDSVTSIGHDAFSNCSGLTAITIPDGVTRIESATFTNCSSLTSITIPDSVTSIGTYAFEGCSSLTDITLPDGITSIADFMFKDCSSLANLAIPDSVTVIGQNAFYGCSSLTAMTIPDGVTSISFSTFCNCSSLATVTIPASVTSIDDYAFDGCSSLTAVIYTGSECQWAQVTGNEQISEDILNCLMGPHAWGEPGYEWAADNGSVTASHVCTFCDASEDIETVQTTSTSTATCTDGGEITYTAEFTAAGLETQTKTIPGTPLGHDLQHHEGKAATCTEAGWAEYDTCSRCDYTTFEEIPAPGHVPGEAVHEHEVPATCTTDGSYEEVVYCTVCEAEISRTAKTVGALGHDLQHHEGKAATCTESGWAEYDTCSRCDYTTYAELEALGHLPGEPEIENETEPTATQAGGYDSVTYCTRCGAELDRTHYVLPPLSSFITITNCKLELAGKISIRLYFRAPENAKTAKIFYEDVNTHGYPETAAVTLELTRTGNPNYSASQDLFIMTFPKITSREMTRNIRFVVYDQNDRPMWIYYQQGDTYFEDGFEYCAADWANRILAKVDSTDAAKFMAKALLNYGGCAQVYLNNFNPDKPANPMGYLADEMAALLPDPDNDMEVPDEAAEIGFDRAKLALEADTTIRLYFTKPVRVWVDGVEKRVYESGGQYLVMIEGISSRNISKKYRITVTNKASGASTEILYSVLSWCNKQIADENANSMPTAKALYLYNQAAKAYIK